MKINHNRLKSIFQTHLKEKKVGSRKNCPSVDDMINLVRSELPKSKSKKLLNHIQDCPSCSKEIQTIIQILKEEKKFMNQINELSENHKNKPKIKRIFNFTPNLSWKSISLSAAALLLVFAVSFSVYTVLNEHKYRGDNRSVLKITAPKKKIIIYENHIQFRWDDVPGTQFYKAVLFNQSLYPIWESDKLSRNKVNLPNKVQKKMKHKATYFLLISSYQKNGKIIESPFKEFKVLIKHSKN